MAVTCDVLVVGAGPAGLGAALTCVKLGLKTIVLEKMAHLGIPIKTSALTWNTVFDNWILDSRSIAQKISKISLNFNNGEKKVLLDFGKTVGGTLNYSYFLQELATRFVETGGTILIGATCEKPLLTKERVCGAIISYQGKKREITAKLVIDASGPSAVIAKHCNNHFPKDAELGFGIEFEFTNLTGWDNKTVAFYGGDKIVPVGYGWIFPAGQKRARVGVCTVFNTSEKVPKQSLLPRLNNFISISSVSNFLRTASVLEEHAGAYLLSGPLEKPYGEGYLVVGDAASHASSLLGEGIRYALEFGKYAAITAKSAIKKSDFSEQSLNAYKKKCDEYLAETFLVAGDLLGVPTNEYWQHLTERLAELKKEGDLGLALSYFKTAMDYEDAYKIFPKFKGMYLRRKK
jgi:digeranylgeranylglycerophospholipid reductase